MRRTGILLLALCLLLGTAYGALAEQVVRLPGTGCELTLPDDMQLHESRSDDADSGMLFAYLSPALEIDFFTYTADGDLRIAAENMAAAGREAELRTVNGIEMICARLHDGTDNVDGVTYAFRAGEKIVEIIFWYSDQEAAELTKTIIASLRES